jgi:DNA-binding GntR family transcriptional regulator
LSVFYKENRLDSYGKQEKTNYKFHTSFYRLARNNVLHDLIEQLKKKVLRYRYTSFTLPGHVEKYVEDHEQILNALENRNYRQASKLMEMHVDRVRRTLVDFFKNFP